MRTTQRVQRHRVGRLLATVGLSAGLIAGAATVATPAGAVPGNHYSVTNLVSDQAGVAEITDPNLTNAWGLSAGPSTPIWVANNHSDTTTVYPGAVNGSPIVGPALTVPIDGGAPTGTVFNGTTGFMMPTAGAPANFIFASESGNITAWSSADAASHALVMAHNDEANYKGLALAESRGAPYLYAANFETNAVDVYDSTFTLQHWSGAFTDRRLPRNYAPFGITAIGREIYVSYALHVPGNDDDTAGVHHGFVDVFGTNGKLHRRLLAHGALNSPWGMAVAPKGFGPFSGALLVGNFGDGRINAYDRHSGRLVGRLRDANGAPIVIGGLWALKFGNGVTGAPNQLLFTAGPDDEMHGLFGVISAT